MRCRHCDYTNTEDAVVCANCGVPLERPMGQRPQGEIPRGQRPQGSPQGSPQRYQANPEPPREEPHQSNVGGVFFGGFILGVILTGAAIFIAPKYIDIPFLPTTTKEPNMQVEKPKEEPQVEEEESLIGATHNKEELMEKPAVQEEGKEEEDSDELTVGQALDNLFVTKPVEVVVPTPDLVAVFAGANKEELLLLPCAKAGEEVDLEDIKIKCEDLGVSTYGAKLGIDNNTEVDTFGCVKVLIQNTTSHDIPFKNLMVYLFEEEFGQINVADTCVVAGTTTTTGVFLQDLGDTLKVGETINMLIPYSKKYDKGIAYISLVNQDTDGKGTVVKLHE